MPPFLDARLVLVVGGLVTVGCSGSTEGQESEGQESEPEAAQIVQILVDDDGVRLVGQSATTAPATMDRYGDRMLRWEFRTRAGALAASGQVGDPRLLRSELPGEVEGSWEREDFTLDEGIFTVRVPDLEGEIVVFASGDGGSLSELGRLAVSPQVESTGAAALLLETDILGPPQRIAGDRPQQGAVDLLFLPEGYTEDELDKFHRDVESLTAGLLTEPLFAARAESINVWRQDVRSRESGIDDPHLGIVVDTAFDFSRRPEEALRRCIQPFTVEAEQKLQQLAAAAGADATIVLANIDQRGGCATAGMFYMSRCVFPNSAECARPRDEVLKHELGHSLFGLADEYDYGYSDDVCAEPSPVSRPNVSSSPNRDDLPWARYLTTDILPTPATPEFADAVGAVEGAHYCPINRWRPQQQCLMREFDVLYCDVCRAIAHEHIDDLEDPVERACARVSRTSGSNRFATAAAVSRSLYPQGTMRVVLTPAADDSSDALVAGPMAYKYSAPILLTDPDRIPSETMEEIERLGAEESIIVGNEEGVSEDLVRQLRRDHSLGVRRIGGETGTIRAANVALLEVGADAGLAYIASRDGLVDALAASGLAAYQGAPILLVDRNELPGETQLALERLAVTRTIVAGGTQAISDDVLAMLPNPTRVGGVDRFATAAALARHAVGEGVPVADVWLARSDKFPDALAAGASGRPVLLSGTESLPAETQSFLAEYASTVTLLGGHAALSARVNNSTCDVLGCGNGRCAQIDECGDGVCNGNEDDSNCVADCGCSAPPSCDILAPFGCYCDPDCVENGDCCADACSTCGSC